MCSVTIISTTEKAKASPAGEAELSEISSRDNCYFVLEIYELPH